MRILLTRTKIDDSLLRPPAPIPTSGEPSGVAKEFLDFTIGPTGQKIVQQVGFVPIK